MDFGDMGKALNKAPFIGGASWGMYVMIFVFVAVLIGGIMFYLKVYKPRQIDTQYIGEPPRSYGPPPGQEY